MQAKRLDRWREEVRLRVREERGYVEEALYAASLAGDADAAAERSAPALQGFDELAAKVDQASSEELDWISKQAAAYGRTRAYVLPADALYLEAVATIHDLEDWRLPASVIQALKGWAEQIREAREPEHVRRIALLKLLEDYDYWDAETEWYEGFLGNVAYVLLPACVIPLVLALVIALWCRTIVPAFLLASVSGAALSILLKLPPLKVYGEAVGAWQRMLGRLAAGLVASAIGLGLLASGVVTLGIPQGDKGFLSPASALRACSGGGQTSEQCDLSSVLLLLALGIVIGFSERALASFEGTVIGGVVRTKSQTRREKPTSAK